MPRIAGIDLPEKKKIRYALRYIHGIGPKASDVILSEAEIDGDKRASELTDQEVSQIATVIDAGHIVEGSLSRATSILPSSSAADCARVSRRLIACAA